MFTLFNHLLTYPLLNLLAFFIWLVPGHQMAWGVLFLTLLVRLILLIPSKRAAQSQRKLQELQPLLEELKKEYGDDKQGLVNAQMELWKKNNINPFASCAPILIQIPVLYSLYWVIARGFSQTQHLYSWVPRVSADQIQTHLGKIDLLKADPYFLFPVLAAGLQFIQLRMSMPKMSGMASSDPGMAMQRNMLYIFPVLTLFIANKFPAGVGLYWVVTTLFSIGQQYFVNKEKLRLQGVTKALKESETQHPEHKMASGPEVRELKSLEISEKEVKKGVLVTVRKKKR